MTTYNVLTLFPQMFESVKDSSIWARAAKAGHIAVNTIDIRDYTKDKHKRADDYPFGGGAGMVLMPEPVDACFREISRRGVSPALNIYMSPSGRPLSHSLAVQLSAYGTLNILCGHYEGIDERVLRRHIEMEISVGDYVLTGGELAAMVLIDACMRHVSGVLGCGESAAGDSFADGLLEYPQYTRPAVFDGEEVPDVLISGDHAKVADYRRRMSLERTARKRPDLLSKTKLSNKDIQILTQKDMQDS
ncbi:MAG: tRNA (guanosine(37)-N1)-methyltransferase TrmD [Christensenellales bacterium]